MRGKTKYFPSVVFEELEDLKTEHNINSDNEAIRKMVDYTRIGREVERIAKFKFGHKPTSSKKKRGGGLF